MRRTFRLLLALVALVIVLPVASPAAHLPGGPIILMGIDAEDGGAGGHGPTSTYASVVNDLLANASKGTGILVLGGRKTLGDNTDSFWSAVGTATGQVVTYANGPAVGTVSFTPFEIVAVVSSYADTPGGLSVEEGSLINARDADFAAHVNAGGGLLGFSQGGISPSYGYLDALGSITAGTGGGYSDVTATAEGLAVGLDNATLDVCCWHDNYLTYPSFLLPLMTYPDARIAAIGGRNVHILVPCDAATMVASVTRPVAGRLYSDDADAGSNGLSIATVRGTTLTVNATATGSSEQAQFFFDGLLVGVDPSPPHSLSIPLPAVLGDHTIRVRVFHANEPCFDDTEILIRIVCFDATPAILRPVAGRLYRNNVDIGASDTAEAAVLEGLLTVDASSVPTAGTTAVRFEIDGIVFGTDVTSPYSAAVNTTPLLPGTHTLSAIALERVPGCGRTTTVTIRKPDPAVAGRGRGLKIVNALPVEPQITAGGAQVGGKGGPLVQTRLVDRSAPNIDYVQTIVDTAQGQTASNPTARSSSTVQRVSLLAGMITADVLEAHAYARLDLATQMSETSSLGSRIVGLRVGVTPIDVVEPNMTIAVPGVGTLVLQETIEQREGFRTEITVNALHLYLNPGYPTAEIILGSAHAGVNFLADVFTGALDDRIHDPDDLSSGGEAGNSIASATPIGEGIFEGSISKGDPADVYSFNAKQGQRIIAVVKPAERAKLHLNPPPASPSFVVDAPNVELILYGADGAVRSTSELSVGLSSPQRVQFNADLPFDGSSAPYHLEVRRRDASPDGFYTIELSILPVPLREQNDADQPGDASDACASARTLVLGPSSGELASSTFAGVIRDADPSDFYGFTGTAGRAISIAVKPDELDDGADFDLYLYGPDSPGGGPNCVTPIEFSVAGGDGSKGMPELVTVLPVLTSGTYVFEVRRVNGVGNYYVNVGEANAQPTIAAISAEPAGDAGDSCGSATTMTPGAYQGTMIDVPDSDVEDWFSVTMTPGQDLTVVMKPNDLSNFELELYDPACTLVPPDQLTLQNLPLSAPETVHIANASGGAYKVRVSRNPNGSAGNYGLVVLITP